jgi:hypothetical protein
MRRNSALRKQDIPERGRMREPVRIEVKREGRKSHREEYDPLNVDLVEARRQDESILHLPLPAPHKAVKPSHSPSPLNFL